MSALEGIADELAQAVHVADVPRADIDHAQSNFLRGTDEEERV